MSFSEVLEALPDLTFEERQLLIRRAIELDDTPLSEDEENLVESRLAAHHLNPTSSPLYSTPRGTIDNGSSESKNATVKPQSARQG